MTYDSIPICVKGSDANTVFNTYLLDNSREIDPVRKRPMVILCPGGAYAMVSDREAEAIAIKFLNMGFHAGILRYSVAPAAYPTALVELASVIETVHLHASEWNVDTDYIFLQGSSAGGHLAASYGVLWHREDVWNEIEAWGYTVPKRYKVAGMLLSYPVISTKEDLCNRDSFENLLGSQMERYRSLLSLEEQVSADTPPCFIWHTFTDQRVPAGNSLCFVEALYRNQVPVEFHLYPVGIHGLGLATKETAGIAGNGVQKECASWIDLAETWIEYVKKLTK